MKSFLKITGIVLLIVILLMLSLAENAKAESRIEITPEHLVISGIVDSGPFQHPFTVRAVNGDITELTFSSGNLMEVSGGRSWIAGLNVQITPAVSRIKKGQSQDFLVTIQNIPGSGQYSGIIAISYKEQAAEFQDTLSISVRAAKFSANPPQIILRFEKSFFGLGGTGDVPWTLILSEDSEHAPQEMMTTLAKATSIALNPLVNSDDKSQLIRPDQILTQSDVPETRPGGQGLIIRTNFTNPQVTAGKYIGTLSVRSEALGLLVSVPVEVQVRSSGWLAWLLILAGIITSIMVSWWNTTGKKKNAIQGEALKLREKLRSADITLNCGGQIEGMLDEVRELLREDKLEDAQKKVTEADTTLETCVGNKKKLREKAAEVKGLIEDLENSLVEPIKRIVGTDAIVLKTYMPGVKKAFETLKNDIEEERYESVDERLNKKFVEQKEKLNAFTDPAPEGLLDGLAELEEDLGNLDQAYRPALEQNLIQPIKVHLGAIKRDKDVQDIAAEIRNADTQVQKVTDLIAKLNDLSRLIELEQQEGLDMTKAKEKLGKCKQYLASGNIAMAEGHLADVENAIEEASRVTLTAVDRRDLLKNLAEILQPKAEVAPPPPLPPQPTSQPPSPSQLNILDRFRNGWTPERQERTISAMLFLGAIIILAVIGFSQLYANNPTFGAKNAWEEYLALFLWGFGIQTGIATVANVIKTFHGA